MMKHTFNISIAALSVAAMSLLAAGCQKQDKLGLNDGDAPLSFSVGVTGEADFEQTGSDGRATKADNRKTAITEFKIRGYEGTERWFPNTDADQTVSTSSMAYNDYIWRSGTQHTFYAYANLPASGATASIASDGVTLNYTAVPTAQASQQDILLGSYKGKGTNGKASIQFYHPLAAVAFKVGEISGVTKISSITLDGVYKSGSVKLSETSGTPAFAWTASTTQNGVNQTSLNVTTFTTNTAIGDPFILIPQTFSSKPLTVKIALTTAEGDKTVTATLSTGSIAAGKTTTYAVNYSAAKGLNFSTPTVTAWGTGDSLTAELEEKTGPDPNFWIDLGMVSSNGNRLYISKYNVKKVNGSYVFDTEGTGDDFTYSEAQSITEVDGQACRLPEEREWFDLIMEGRGGTAENPTPNPNVSWELDEGTNTYTVTSILHGVYEGLSIQLPLAAYYSKNSDYHLCPAKFGGEDIEACMATTRYTPLTLSSLKVRMVIEDDRLAYEPEEDSFSCYFGRTIATEKTEINNKSPKLVMSYLTVKNGFVTSNCKVECDPNSYTYGLIPILTGAEHYCSYKYSFGFSGYATGDFVGWFKFFNNEDYKYSVECHFTMKSGPV